MSEQGGLARSYVLKVTLNHVEPSVWRRIQVPATATLDALHVVLQRAMGWENAHLYEFEVGKQTFSPPETSLGSFPGGVFPYEEPTEEEMQTQVVEGLKQLASMIEHPEEGPEREAQIAALMETIGMEEGAGDDDSGIVEIRDVLKRTRSKMTYRYDFGDGWEHTVVVEKTNVPTNAEQPAICLDGAGACPPEDSGGPWGYRRVVAAVQNPNDPEYEETREWLSEWMDDFDPNAFDRDAVNRSLARLTWGLSLTE